MSETTPLIKAALNLRVGVGFDVYEEIMKLKVSKESASGLNTEFVNVETGRRIPLEQAVAQISKGNKNYENYQVVNKSDGTTYIRSKADGIKKNNIEE